MKDLTSFEQSLKAMKPVEASTQLRDQIGTEISKAKPSSPRYLGIIAVISGAAAILTLTFLLLGQHSGPEQPSIAETSSTEVTDSSTVPEDLAVSLSPEGESETFRPIDVENTLQNTIDEGIVFLKNGLPARRYRYQFLDRVVWENARGSRMEMEIPRDEVVLVPVQTF